MLILTPSIVNAQEPASEKKCCVNDSSAISETSSEPVVTAGNGSGNFVRTFVQDQRTLWASPFRLRSSDVPWVVGAAGTTALLIGSDTAIQAHVGTQHVGISRRVSDGGVALFAGAAGAFYGVGALTQNEHARETGRLTGEAAIDALAMNSTLQFAFGRARPGEKNAADFFAGGNSFPSNHSAVAWAAASVIAHEYPGWTTKTLSYGLASVVSLTRITADKHYASDVFVGSTLGWFVGQQIYRKRHDKDLPGTSWGTFSNRVERVPNPTRQASPYVPLDSWVYPALDRLAALGEVPGGFYGLRPWTRMECAGLLKEALDANALNGAVERESSYSDLQDEFAYELQVLNGGRNVRARLESVYTRVTNISGPPLTDGFHFGQTLTNDYGRPFQEGLNSVNGVSADAEAGPIAFYIRGEYQHAPGLPPLSDQVRTAIAASNQFPIAPAVPFNDVNRFRLLDAYVALNLSGWQASFGKQSFWWGPGVSGDLMLSDNAEPTYMFAFSRVSPLKLPSVLGWLGEMKPEFFVGQLQGYNFLRIGPTFTLTGSYDKAINPQPFIWGGKLSVKPTPNLEIGFSITSVFAGLGRPMTLRTFLHTFSQGGNGQALEPGDRRSGFDFSYRVPGLRKWLVLYNGSMAEDEPSPIASPRRSAMNPGIYLPQIPKFHRLDFRAEGVYTNLPSASLPGLSYRNAHYADGYTNYGQLMGSWIGPQASGVQLWSTYWWSGQKKLQFGYRKEWVDPTYVGGGSLQDLSGRYDFPLGKQVSVSGLAQYERWQFPVIANGPNSNVAVSVQFTYKPGWTRRASRQ